MTTTTTMNSPEARLAAVHGRMAAERELEALTSYLPPREAVGQLVRYAGEMVQYCWQNEMGWVKYSYYDAMERTFREALAELDEALEAEQQRMKREMGL